MAATTTIVGGNRVLRWPEVHERTGLCRSHVHNLVAKGEFPKPIKLGKRASAWIESEVENWLRERIEQSRSDDCSKGGVG